MRTLRSLFLLVAFVGLNVAGWGFLLWWGWQARAFVDGGEWLPLVGMFVLLFCVCYVCAGRDGRAEIVSDVRRWRAEWAERIARLRGRGRP